MSQKLKRYKNITFSILLIFSIYLNITLKNVTKYSLSTNEELNTLSFLICKFANILIKKIKKTYLKSWDIFGNLKYK